MDKFKETFDKYRDHRSKYESSYIVIVFDLNDDKIIDNINHQISIINTIGDKVRRNYLLTRIFNFRDYIQTRFNKSVLTGVFMIKDDIEYIELCSEWKKNVLSFDVNNFIFIHDEYFDIDYLQDLLLNKDDYNHVINVSQNKFVHCHNTKTKKKYISSGTANHAELNKYLADIKSKYIIIHGVGQMLKNFTTNNKDIKVCAKLLTDESLYEEIEKLNNSYGSERLTEILDKLNTPNIMDKIVFGKEINKGISEQMIKTIFCTTDMKKKILTKIPKDLQTFEIIEVKSFNDKDVGHILESQYSGIIGVKYYSTN